MNKDKVFDAVHCNDLEKLKAFIENENVALTLTNYRGETLASVAASNGNWKMFRYIVDKDPSALAEERDKHVAFREAIKRGALNILKYLFEKYRMNVDEPAGYKNEPHIFSAVECQRQDIIQYLIESVRVNLTVLNGEKENILYRVVTLKDDPHFVKYVFDEKRAEINVDHRNKRGETLVYLAALNNRTATLEYLVSKKHADVNIPDARYQRTPLHCAAFKNHFEICKYLVDRGGAELNHKDCDGATPLDCAASPNIWKYLIEHGANFTLDQPVHRNKTPLLAAVSLNRRNVCAYLLDQHGADIEQAPLYLTVSKKGAKVCECLVERGANVNQKNHRGETPLHLAIKKRFDYMSRYLIQHRANVNLKNNKGETPLHYAASWKNCQGILEVLIKAGARVNEKNYDGDTPLHYAVSRKQLGMSKYFIKHGADVNQANNKQKTPLYYAIVQKHFETLKCLVENGARINEQDCKGETPLHYTITEKEFEMFKYLIKNGADVNKANNDGKPPLHYAMFSNQFKMFKYLVENGADINKGDHKGETALHNAVTKDTFKIFKYLLEQRVNINKRNNRGKSVLDYTIEHNRLKMCKSLVQQGAQVDARTLVQRAFDLQHYNIVHYLIANVPGVDTNQIDSTGKTLLHLAVSKDLVLIIKCLTTHGADINKEDNQGETPLHLCHSYEVCKYLIEHGADVNHKDSEGKTFLQKAEVENENICSKISKYLVEHGADVNCADEYGQTALHDAVYSENIQKVKLLLAHGANINQRTKEGNTALHYASLHNGCRYFERPCQRTLECLIDQNVSNIDINAENIDGDIPLHFAASNRYCSTAMTKYLVTHGANVNHKNKEGNTALHLACQHRYKGASEFLLKQGADANLQNIHGQSPLHKVALNGDVKCLQCLLAQGANINLKDKNGNTALHLVASHSDLDVSEILMKHKDIIDINAENMNGETPLYYALCHLDSSEEFTRYLIAQGASINHKNKRGETPLHYRFSRGYESLLEPLQFDTIKFLVENGADVNQSDSDGTTLLHLAISRSRSDVKDVFKYFIEHGSDINKANNRGETPVHLASKLNEIDLLTYLIGDQRADVNVRRKGDLWTPLHCAAFWGHQDCCEYLIKHDADIRAKDKDGRTPAELASEERLIAYMRNVTTKRSRRNVEYPTLKFYPNLISHNGPEKYRRVGSVNCDKRTYGVIRTAALPDIISLVPQFQSFLTLIAALFQNSNVLVYQRSQMETSIFYLKRAFLEKKMDSTAEVAVDAFLNYEGS